MITIHDKYENDFSKNGFGDISQNVLNPEVSWKMNGEFKVSFSYPIFAKHSQHLLDENIVRVPVPYMDDQLFRIYKPNKELGYVEVEARHIFYDLLTNFIEDTNIVGQHGDNAIKQLLDRTVLPHKFYGSSDISTMTNMRVVRYNPVEALLDDGKANTFVSRWGGQLHRDNFNIRMDRRIGSNRGVTIQYRKDLLGFDASIDHSSKVNRLMPIGFDGLILPEKYIDSPNIDMNDIRIGVVRYQDVKAAIGQYEEDEDAIPLEDAYDLLRQGAAKEFAENKIDQPISSFKVDFVTLENTKEYEEFSYLQEIRQGDTVRVSVPDEGIDVESIMVEFKSNPLRKNHYDSVTLGSFTDSLTSSVPKLSIIRQELDEHNELIISNMLAANRKNRLFFGTRNPNELQLVGLTLGDTYFQEDGDWFAIWEYVEVNGERYWRKGPNTDFGKELETEIASVISQAETDRQNAQQAADKAFEDAKDYADSEVLRIESEISQDVGNALSIAQQALDDVSAQANQALQDAKNYADQEVGIIGQYFTNIFNGVQNDLDSTSQLVNTLNADVNAAINSAGFLTLEETISKLQTDSTSAVNMATTLIDDYGILTGIVSNVDNRVTSIQTTIDGIQTTVAGKASQTQVTQLAALVDTKVTSSQVNQLIRNDKTIIDTRDDNQNPDWYFSNYSREVVREFKRNLIMGVSGEGTYGILETIIPWSGSSGGRVKQTLTTDYGIWERTGTGTTWQDWKRIADRNWVGSQLTIAENAILAQVVSKDDIINQINISTEGILIAGTRVHITGQTYIDDAVIKNSHIESLHANKINAGTIDSARINATQIVTNGLSANIIKSTHVETSTATVNKIFATDVMVNTLTAKTAFISSIQAIEINAARITSGTISTARLNVQMIVASGLYTNVVRADHIFGDTALFDKLFATNMATDRLSARTAWIKNANIADAEINGAKIADATIGSAKIASLDVSKIRGDTANFIIANFNSGTHALTLLATGLRSSSSNSSYLLGSDGVTYYSGTSQVGNMRGFTAPSSYQGHARGLAIIARSGYETHLGYGEGGTGSGNYERAITIDGTTGNIYMNNIYPLRSSSQGLKFATAFVDGMPGVSIRNTNTIGAGLIIANNGHIYIIKPNGYHVNLTTYFN